MTSVLEHIGKLRGHFDLALYRKLVGAANAFKEGDATVGVASSDESDRRLSRELLRATRVEEIAQQPLHLDAVHELIRRTLDPEAYEKVRGFTLSELKTFLLDRPERDIKALRGGLHSDVIACVVRLMTNDELVALGSKLFNPLPGSHIGARGYMGARIQPNSPTDHSDDIVWQVFNGWSFAVGDVLLGTNPVDSRPESVAIIERALLDVTHAFDLEDVLPHCVLSHIDVQAEVEAEHPGLTSLWFQSLGGTESANKTFGLTVEKMLRYAQQRTGQFGLYLETGQGADFTNGHAHGFDMVAHESRKYGFARALQQQVAAVCETSPHAWLHVNDVAGFIGPEVFRNRDQLVRCCLEDIAMGKLHGLTLGLDICSTLHMDVTLVHDLYDDAKVSLWAELTEGFTSALDHPLCITSKSTDRADYIFHPSSGEELDDKACASLRALRASWNDARPDVQIVISDGLNARAITDDGHVSPYLDALRAGLEAMGRSVAQAHIVITNGRVRAGYRCGEILFADTSNKPRAIIHLIGERPGSGQHCFSAYLAIPPASTWSIPGAVDHDIAAVVSGISDTALDPFRAAQHTVQILERLVATAPASRTLSGDSSTV